MRAVTNLIEEAEMTDGTIDVVMIGIEIETEAADGTIKTAEEMTEGTEINHLLETKTEREDEAEMKGKPQENAMEIEKGDDCCH